MFHILGRFVFYLIFFKQIESRFPDGFNSVWLLLL